MKATKFFAMMLFGMTALAFVACGDDKDEPVISGGGGEEGGGEIVIPQPGPDPSTWTIDQQKQHIDATGREVAGLFPVSSFKEILEVANYAYDHYSGEGDYDFQYDAIEDEFERMFDNATHIQIGARDEVRDENSYTDSWLGITYVYKSIEHYTDIKRYLKAADFTGHFTAGRDRWEYTPANDLKFFFNGGNGQQCELSATTSGATTRVYICDIEDFKDYENNTVNTGNTEYTTYNYYYENNKVYADVPQVVTATLTRGGKQLVSVETRITLTGVSGDVFDLAKGTVSVTSTVKIGGMTINLSRVDANASGTSTVSATATQNGTQVVAVDATVNSKVSGHTQFDNLDMDDLTVTSAACPSFSVSVLGGKVQVKGSISDIKQLSDELDAMDKNERNEGEFKSHLNSANALIDCKVYYNGSANSMAKFTIVPEVDRDGYYSREYWSAQPGLLFNDGTTYTFEKFFNEDDFKALIDTFDKLGDDYERELDKFDL